MSCRCNCHKDWWAESKHQDCIECANVLLNEQEEMHKFEIELYAIELRCWKESAIRSEMIATILLFVSGLVITIWSLCE